MRIQNVFMLLLLIPIAGCSSDKLPDFIRTPTEPVVTDNENVTVITVPTATTEKRCFLENYAVLNKLCRFPDFWADFSFFMQKWISYKIILLILAIFIGIRLIRAWRAFA